MTELSAATAALAEATSQLVGTKAEWIELSTGPVDGGPNGDGMYPVTAADGTILLVPGIAKISAMNGSPEEVEAAFASVLSIATGARDGAEGFAASAEADRVQTGLDRAAAAADRNQTGLDRTATGADRTQAGLDRVVTQADAAMTTADRAAAHGSSTAAAGSAATATTQANLALGAAGVTQVFATYALAMAGIATITNLTKALVLQDETNAGREAIYTRNGAALTLVGTRIPQTEYAAATGELANALRYFGGATGNKAIVPYGGSNSIGNNEFGSGQVGLAHDTPIDRFSQFSGTPSILMLWESKQGFWLGYVHSGGIDARGLHYRHRTTVAKFLPGKIVKFTDAAIKKTGGAAVTGGTLTAADSYWEYDGSSRGAHLAVGLVQAYNDGSRVMMKVDVTDAATANPITTGLLLATAAQWNARYKVPIAGGAALPSLAANQLTTGGGVLDPSDRVASGTPYSRYLRAMSFVTPVGFWRGGIAAPKVRVNRSTAKDASAAGSGDPILYGFAVCTSTDVWGGDNVEPIMVGYWRGNDGDAANEPIESTDRQLNIGGGHGGQEDTVVKVLKNGQEQILFARSTTLVRTNGVTTVTFDKPIGNVIGNSANRRVSFSLFPALTSAPAQDVTCGSNGNYPCSAVTVVNAYTLSWTNPAWTANDSQKATFCPDIAAGAYLGGYVVPHQACVTGAADDDLSLYRESNIHDWNGVTLRQISTLKSDVTIKPGMLLAAWERTAVATYTRSNGAYAIADTVNCGEPTTWGPEYAGDVVAHVLGGGPDQTFATATAQTDHYIGKALGIVAHHPSTGQATLIAYDSFAPWKYHTASSVARITEFVLPLSGVTRSVRIKVYFSLVNAGTVIVPIGTVERFRTIRADGEFDPASAKLKFAA